MDLKNLETFIQVAELTSFTKAAEKLGYSQSTISFQIKQLENELNAQLFERINHTVTLTERGKEVLGYAHQISKLTKEMEKPATENEHIGGHIRMAMADSLCNWLLTNDFVYFHALYPDITLKMVAASTEEMFRLLNQNEVDLVYTLDQHFYDKNYVIVSEKKIDAHFVGSPKIFQKKHYSLEELVKFPFILTEKGMSYRRLMDEKLASMSLEVEPLLETGNTSLICHLVEQNIGISYLPDYVTEDSVRLGKLIRLNLPEFEIDIWQQLLYHRSKWVTPQMQAVMDYLSQKGI
ncbi:MAG: LysR family transcriptional regulator [Lachnospiraceae bacterium]|nr:LysR family transcriptional regulator [Lachnospiraceae bacterium]